MRWILLALAVGGCPKTPDPERPAKPAGCAGLDSALADAAEGDLSRASVDDEGRVHVVVETEDRTVLPASFLVEVDARRMIQGWIDPTALCELGAAAAVTQVRVPVAVEPMSGE